MTTYLYIKQESFFWVKNQSRFQVAAKGIMDNETCGEILNQDRSARCLPLKSTTFLQNMWIWNMYMYVENFQNIVSQCKCIELELKGLLWPWTLTSWPQNVPGCLSIIINYLCMKYELICKKYERSIHRKLFNSLYHNESIVKLEIESLLWPRPYKLLTPNL